MMGCMMCQMTLLMAPPRQSKHVKIFFLYCAVGSSCVQNEPHCLTPCALQPLCKVRDCLMFCRAAKRKKARRNNSDDLDEVLTKEEKKATAAEQRERKKAEAAQEKERKKQQRC